MKSLGAMQGDLDRALGHARKLHGNLTVLFENFQAMHHMLRSDIEEIYRLRREGALAKPDDPQPTEAPCSTSSQPEPSPPTQ